MRPYDDGIMRYVLLAVDESGLYFADGLYDEFKPQRELLSLLPEQMSASGKLVSVSGGPVSFGPAGETRPNPIAASVRTGSRLLSYEIFLHAMNPFPFPIAATVSQGLPPGVTVDEAGDGVVSGSTIRWQRVIPPHMTYDCEYEVIVAGSPGTQVEVPAAQLTFYSPEFNDVAVFTDFPLTLEAKVPLVATATEPLPSSKVITVTVSNLASRVEEGTIGLTVFDMNGSEVAGTTAEVIVQSKSEKGVEVPVPQTLQADTAYIVSVVLDYDGIETDVLWAQYLPSDGWPPPSSSTKPPTPVPPRSNGPLIALLVLLALAGGGGIVFALLRQGGTPGVGVRVIRGQAERPYVRLRRGQVLIGRAPGCDLRLLDDTVSSRHAMIQRTSEGYVLTDLRSTNGTFVNGERVGRCVLHPGDEIKVGAALLRFG